MRVLITGITGFVGSHLTEYCLQKGDKVFGTVFPNHLGNETKNIDKIVKKVTLFTGDLLDYSFVYESIRKAKPDVIFHLAAQSFVQDSFKAPELTLKTNIFPELYIFEAIKSLNWVDKVKVHIAGSSEEYGMVEKKECPITTKNVLRPLSPYAVSKITQDYLAQQYFRSWGLKTVITRAFNHEGARRDRRFVLSTFAEQIVRIEKGLQAPEIKVGNLKAYRDFTDVRDMVKAYYLAVKKCDYGVPYNIGSGKMHQIEKCLQILLQTTTYKGKIAIVQDPARMRPSDVEILHASCVTFTSKTNWKPKYKIEETLQAILSYWREEYEKI